MIKGSFEDVVRRGGTPSLVSTMETAKAKYKTALRTGNRGVAMMQKRRFDILSKELERRGWFKAHVLTNITGKKIALSGGVIIVAALIAWRVFTK